MTGLGFLTWWPWEPAVILGVAVSALLYVAGAPRRPRPMAAWRSAAFAAGLGVVLVALQSPLEMLARQLFWLHMVQHLLLITVAAPLLALASPWLRMWRGLPLTMRRRVARVVVRSTWTRPVRTLARLVWRPWVLWVLAAANLWLWHLPALYDLTLRNHVIHHVEHALFLGLGLAFWAQVIDQHPFHTRLTALQRAAYVFAAMLQSWVLAGVLAFSTQSFYAYALIEPRPFGVSALADQQLGAGMMWVPGAISYSIAFVVFLFMWLEQEEETVQPPRPAVVERPGLGR